MTPVPELIFSRASCAEFAALRIMAKISDTWPRRQVSLIFCLLIHSDECRAYHGSCTTFLRAPVRGPPIFAYKV